MSKKVQIAELAGKHRRWTYDDTFFAFDGANQLVSSTTDGVTTEYTYDAAGRLVKEVDCSKLYDQPLNLPQEIFRILKIPPCAPRSLCDILRTVFAMRG